jgi:hypothetical protein
MQQFVKLQTVKSWSWLVMTAVMFVTLGEPRIALAGTITTNATGVSATASANDATDFSAARRRRYSRGGNAAGLSFMGMAIGTIGAIAAQQRRDDYYNNYNNGYGYGRQGYYGGGPRYYRRY